MSKTKMNNIIKNVKENIEWLDKNYWELRDDGHYEEALKILDILFDFCLATSNMEKSILKLYEEEKNIKNEKEVMCEFANDYADQVMGGMLGRAEQYYKETFNVKEK